MRLRLMPGRGEKQPPGHPLLHRALFRTHAAIAARMVERGLGLGRPRLGPRPEDPRVQQAVIAGKTRARQGRGFYSLVSFSRQVVVPLPKELGGLEMPLVVTMLSILPSVPLPLTIYYYTTKSRAQAHLGSLRARYAPGVLKSIDEALEQKAPEKGGALVLVDDREQNAGTAAIDLATRGLSRSAAYFVSGEEMLMALIVVNIGAYRGVVL